MTLNRPLNSMDVLGRHWIIKDFEGPRRKCAAIADDGKGMLLLFDPTEDSFVLAESGSKGLTTFGVRGDAVGCFLAR